MNQKYDQNHIENDTFIEMFYFPKADKSQTKGMERQRNKKSPDLETTQYQIQFRRCLRQIRTSP